MEVIITGEAKEIAALLLERAGRRNGLENGIQFVFCHTNPSFP